jgi:pantoate--beta-alanine ligase
MEICKTKTEIQSFLDNTRRINLSIGFVPTMGALHKGHLSLIRQSVQNNGITVASIFVNPTQFNDSKDFKRYPRTPDEDIELLNKEHCDVVFQPEVSEIYPEKDTRIFDFGHLDKEMEGKYRPGHFNGVASVVSKFFDIVQPDSAYFGKKDFQQYIIIKKLVELLNMNINIVPCRIIRDKNGLAMSSRNKLLNPEQKKQAPVIYQTLKKAVEMADSLSVEELTSWVIERINQYEHLKTEYFEIVNSETLHPLRTWDKKVNKTGCIGVYAGNIRLIDNIQFDNQN